MLAAIAVILFIGLGTIVDSLQRIAEALEAYSEEEEDEDDTLS